MELNKHEKAWQNLTFAYLTLQRAIQLESARVRLTIPQRLAVYYLKTSEEPLTINRLARRMKRQPHTVSTLVHGMETRGLVRTTKDTKRKDLVRVSLTRMGQEAFKREMSERTIRSAITCLSDEELDKLNATCEKLRQKGRELIRELRPNSPSRFDPITQPPILRSP